MDWTKSNAGREIVEAGAARRKPKLVGANADRVNIVMMGQGEPLLNLPKRD